MTSFPSPPTGYLYVNLKHGYISCYKSLSPPPIFIIKKYGPVKNIINENNLELKNYLTRFKSTPSCPQRAISIKQHQFNLQSPKIIPNKPRKILSKPVKSIKILKTTKKIIKNHSKWFANLLKFIKKRCMQK